MHGTDRSRGFLLGALALSLGLCACSSGSDTPASSDGGAAASPGGPLTWLDDGKKHAAQFASGARVVSASMDMVQISGGEPSGIGISFGVSMPAPLVPGSYPCGVSGNRIIVSFSYTPGSLAQSCTVTLSSIGAKTGDHVTGTFSATLGAKAITNGAFDVALTVNTL